MAITTTSKKLLTTRAVSTSVSGTGSTVAPTITLVKITDSNYNVLDDTAIDVAGGYLKITGTNFKNGCVVYINNTSVTTTFISSTEVRVAAPSIISGTYSIILFNPDKAGAIYLNLTASPFPTFTTGAGSLGTVYETATINTPVVATSDSAIAYTITSGSLPPGVNLNASTGVLSGTSQLTGSNTTYTFVIDATDAQNQNSSRSFSLTINTDVVTWNSPADSSTITLTQSTAANQALSATSAAGQAITYTANQLPAGLSINGSNVVGTPTTSGSSSTIFTATAANTSKSATRTINWTINPGIDTYFPNVSLLLQTGSTNAQQNNTFLDSSNNNFTVTRSGTAIQGAFVPCRTDGYWSNYFYTNTAMYCPVTVNSMSFGASTNFTIEAWLNWPSALASGNETYFELTGTTRMILGRTSTGFRAFWNGTEKSTTYTFTPGVWYHIAVVRNSGTVYFYVNGTQINNFADTVTWSSTRFNVGVNSDTAEPMTGYVSNLRVINGTFAYAAGSNGNQVFTPPSGPLTQTGGIYPSTANVNVGIPAANTVLLTCQSNIFKDNSINAYTLVVTSTAKVQAVQPFNLPIAYTPATYGGSAYLNGSTDYLTIPAPNGGILDLAGSTDFTIELWFYATSFPASAVPYARGGTNGSQNAQYWTVFDSSGNLQWGFSAGGTSSRAIQNISGFKTNSWYHFAITCSGNTFIPYVNGIAGTTVIGTGSLPTTVNNPALWIGCSVDPTARNFFPGYIAGFRITKGAVIYNGNFTPPKQAISGNNTNLFLNSEDPTNANYFWSNYQSTVTLTANAAVAPNGTTTAVLMTPVASNNQHTWRNGFGPTVGNTYTYSVYYKSAGGQYAHLFIGGGNPGAIFDLINGTVANFNGLTTSSITNAGNGWWRCSITQTAQAGNGNIYYGVGTANNNFITTTTGSESIYFWGPQVELASTVGTYYPTPSNSPVAPSFVLNSGNSGIYDASWQNNLITVGSAQASTTQAKWSPTSMKFNGTSDYLTILSNPALALRTGDFTIEFWMYPTAAQTGDIVDTRVSGDSVNSWCVQLDATNIHFTGMGSNYLSYPYTLNTWTHVAYTRVNGSVSVYINGIKYGSSVTLNNDFTGTAYKVGATFNNFYYAGYIQDLRVTRSARYTSNFTAPTAAFLGR